MKLFLLTLSTLLLLAACAGGAETAASANAVLSVDRRTYAPGDSLVVTLHPVTGESTALCSLELQQRNLGDWQREPTWFVEPTCAASETSDGYRLATALPKGIVAGTYRLALPQLATRPFNVTR